MNKDIFGCEIRKITPRTEQCINGLIYIDNWILNKEHDDLIDIIDSMPWENSLKRRVQQYGYRYDYRKSKNMVISHKENYIGPLPNFLQNIAIRLQKENIFTEIPDEVLINEYLPGQGISLHVDCLPCFTETVCSLSLGSQCIMDLNKDNETIYKLTDSSITETNFCLF